MTIMAIRRLSRGMKTGAFAISAIVLALGTSFPELFVSFTSALKGSPNLSFGLVLGSNIANLSLIAGVAGVISGNVKISAGSRFKRDMGIALVAGVLPTILVLDRNLSRVDGLILLAVYGAYASSFFRTRFEEIGRMQSKENVVYRFFRQFNNVYTKKRTELGRFFVGIALFLFVSDSMVRVSIQIAEILNVPIFLIGLVLVAIGTSLPELAFSLQTLRNGEPSMFFGNLLGSVIANSTLVIGIVAVISPIEVFAVENYLVAVVAFLVIYTVFWFMVRSNHKLSRGEAFVLVCMYALFVFVEFI